MLVPAVDPPAAIVVDCDVAESIPAISAPEGTTHAHVLVRVFTEPIGVLNLPMRHGRLERSELAMEIARALGSELRVRLEACGLSWTGQLALDGLQPVQPPSFPETRRAVLRDGPSMTLAVCTRDRPEGLPALLESLCAQAYERTRILVVDNAPSDGRTRRLVAEFARSHAEVDYVREPYPGLSAARNRAIEASDTDVIAWADDDEVCDRWWAAELARGFVEVPSAAAVTGSVIPAELTTHSQEWFEQYSALHNRRGFARSVFSPATRSRQSPLYPLPPFGIGGNMAWRREAIDAIGRFDCALGPGTLSMDGDDTAAFSMLLLAGGTIVYQPSAVVFHRHRQDYAELHRLLRGYGRGVGAYYASMLARQPSCAYELLRLSRRALRDEFSRNGRRLRRLEPGFPPELLRANRLGLLEGPLMYGRARLRARRLQAEQAISNSPRTGPAHMPPRVTVVVPSDVAEPDQLRRCVRSLQELDYPDYEVIVVDNRPAEAPALELPGARVVREARPGGSAARNRGLALASGEIVAFTDDDVIVDRGWLRAIVERFARQPEAAAVTGLVLPLELETPAQILFEQSGSAQDRCETPLSFERAGRGRVRRREFPDGEARIQSLYQTGEFGQGSNMAFRTPLLRAAGGFDEALGPGTPAPACEDLAVLLELIERGGTLAYEPTAVVHHRHRRTLPELRDQIHGYGIGQTAMITALAVRDPALVASMAAAVPAWIRSLRDPRSIKNARRPDGYHRALARAELLGMLAGPLAYARARRLQRRWQP